MYYYISCEDKIGYAYKFVINCSWAQVDFILLKILLLSYFDNAR